MFGVLRGASCGLKPDQKMQWMNHICGVCLALRDNGGQASRLCTNYDSALISVLYEAQSDRPVEMTTSHCALRGSRFRAEVVSPQDVGAQYAASIALTAGATKIEDHIEDGETALRWFPKLSGHLAQNWKTAGAKLGEQTGFNTQTITDQTAQQSHHEAQPAQDFFYYARPTEMAVASAFQHTAVLAQRPHNAPILYEMGALFGRIMYLLDSYQDYDDDLAQGKFNALAAGFSGDEVNEKAQQLFKEAFQQLKKLFFQLDLPRPDLARQLLVQQLKKRGYRLLDIAQISCASCAGGEEVSATAAPVHGFFGRWVERRARRMARRAGRPRRTRRGCCGSICEALICLDCCTDCCDCCCCGCCCDFDLIDCDPGGACEVCECSLCCCEADCCQCGDGCCCDCDCG